MGDAQLLGGRYQQLEVLGEGGEARVHRAFDTVDGKEVALRLPKNPRSANHRGGPVRRHSGWVEVLGTGEDEAAGIYQVLELLRGETLRHLVQRAPLTEGEWANFVTESLAAVEALHEAGWVHGDLNAENFMFISGTGQWKLLELPFLHFSPLKERSTAFGSIHTIAPEQLQGKAADARSDLYALGCLYYYAASGEWPHAGNRSQDVAISILRFSPPELSEKAGRLSREKAAGVMRLLERDPARRGATVAEARRLLAVA